MFKNYYTMLDQNYRDFMINLIMNLEPYMEKPKQELVSELEEFSQLIFI